VCDPAELSGRRNVPMAYGGAGWEEQNKDDVDAIQRDEDEDEDEVDGRAMRGSNGWST
jgi:hypothetical protein